MADTMRAALAAVGLLRSKAAPRSGRKNTAVPFVPPRREVTRGLPATLRLDLKAALARKDLSGLVWITDHAVERFRERFEPGSSTDDARVLLTARVSQRGRWHSARPRWVTLDPGTGSGPLLENVGYLVAAGRRGDDEIVLPLVFRETSCEPLAVATCLYPTPARALISRAI